MLPSEGFVTSADGIHLYYRRIGTGPDTLVVPNAAYMFDDFVELAADRTVIFYDLRNRGRSKTSGDPAQLPHGIDHDVDDLEAIRAYCGVERITVLGHSYLGAMVVLYACKHPTRVERIVQIGAVPPDAGKKYPAQLTGADATFAQVSAELAELQKESRWDDADARARWHKLLRVLCVTDPADAEKITWNVRDLPNESPGNLMRLWQRAARSLQAFELDARALAPVTVPVLIIHGRRDRQAAYGGGRDWAMSLPNARLVTVEHGAHVPWIEDRDLVFGSIREFLAGGWPQAAQRITALEPDAE
jgi:proline iminopeptidase